MSRILFIVSAIWAAAAVALGAFGAHALRDSLPSLHPLEHVARMEANWETAARYHLIHALAALLALCFIGRTEDRLLGKTDSAARTPIPFSHFSSVICFLCGSMIFSGCLYVMVLGGPRLLGAIVPLGGTLLIVGWLALAWLAFRTKI